MKLYTDHIEADFGTILIATDGAALCALDYEDTRERMLRLLRARFGALELEPRVDPHGYSSRVRAYLGGTLEALEGLAVSTGGTTFQRRVWDALRRVPAGATTSYGALARALGAPNAARAVGLANGQNPVAIAIPCHRVVGADGALRGYAGGLARKRWLLEHEALGAGGLRGGWLRTRAQSSSSSSSV